MGWLKKDGDQVRAGEALFELEGEKASQEIEAVDDGILRILPTLQPGTLLKVGTVIGYLAAAEEPMPAAIGAPTQTESRANADVPRAGLKAPVAAPSVRRLARELAIPLSEVVGTGRGGRILPEDIHRACVEGKTVKQFIATCKPNPLHNSQTAIASPRARRIATELGIDWTGLTGSGAGGRIREIDVRAASKGAPQVKTNFVGQRVPLSSRRRIIAQRLLTSRQQTVPVTLTTKADATNLVNLREQFKSVGSPAPIPSFQDIIMKLVAEALKQHLLLAGRWDDDAIVLPNENELHLGMAVDTDEGLLVPVIRNCGELSLSDLATQSRSLIERARTAALVATDMQGSVFTVTNLGAFGIDAFTPVINYPESAILGLGAIRLEPIVVSDNQVIVRSQLTLSLTFDHRAIDGAPAARFLQTVAQAIANPSAWLLC